MFKEMLTRTGSTYNPELKIWNGPTAGYDSNAALGTYIFDYLKSALAKNPNKVIQIHHETDEKITFAEMFERSVRLAVSFTDIQLKAGDSVVIVARNIPLLMPVSIALQYLGVVITYLDESTVLQNEQKYICQCKKAFKLESRYIQHIKNHPEVNMTCPLCSKICSSKRNLTNHIKLHTRETQFACATCNKPFIRKDKLIIHERIHEKDGSDNTALKLIAPRYVICQQSFTETVLKEVSPENIVTFDENDGSFATVEGLLAENAEIDHEFRPVTVDEPKKVTAIILSTSGTTGSSKFLCLSHATVLDQCLRCHNFVDVGIIFHFVPMNWISGLDGGFGDLLRGKLRITTGERPTPPVFVDVIAKHKVTELFVDAGTLSVLAQYLHQTRPVLDSIKLVSCGGTTVSDKLRLSIQDYIPNGITVIGYGMTEVGGVLSACYEPNGVSVGLLCQGIQVKICSPDGTHLGPHESGEICAKTPHAFLDCLNNKPAREELYDKGGWFMTSDIGYVDDEGFLFIQGRKQDMLQHLNHLVNPVVIETIIESHQGVFKACVVGVTIPVYYDLPVALVQRDKGNTVTEEELHTFVNDKVPDEFHKLNGGIFFVDSFPRTHTGKIKRLDVKIAALQMYSKRIATKQAIK